MIENIRLENCIISWENNRYNLRQPGITLPAVGFDEGSGKGQGWKFGNPFGFRTEEGMKMVLKPGVKPPKHVVVPTKEKIRHSNPLEDLCIELCQGEKISYTIRDVEKLCVVKAIMRGAGSVCVMGESQTGEKIEKTIEVNSQNAEVYEIVKLEKNIAWSVRISVEKGIIQIDELEF